jgi:hypothetical protein
LKPAISQCPITILYENAPLEKNEKAMKGKTAEKLIRFFVILLSLL